MPAGVAVKPLSVVMVVLQCVRSRSHQRHLPPQDVDELRQFVQAGSPQDLSDARYAGIILPCLLDWTSILPEPHCPELVDVNHAVIEAVPALTEEDRTRVVDLD